MLYSSNNTKRNPKILYINLKTRNLFELFAYSNTSKDYILRTVCQVSQGQTKLTSLKICTYFIPLGFESRHFDLLSPKLIQEVCIYSHLTIIESVSQT